VFAHHRKRIELLFAATDAVLTVLAFELAYYTRTRLGFERVFFLDGRAHFFLLLSAVLAWVVLGSLRRVYEYLDSSNAVRVLGNTFRQCLMGGIGVILVQYLFRADLSRSFVLFFFGYNFVLLTLFRWNSRRLMGAFHRGFGAPYHLVVVGNPEKLAELTRGLCQSSPFRIRIAATIDDSVCAVELPKLLANRIVDEVIFNVDGGRLSELADVFLLCDEEGVRTRLVTDFVPHVNSEVTLDRVAGIPLLTFSAAPLDDLSLLLKRFLDLVISILALILLSPFMLLAAILIKAGSPGPVIYRQIRCGLNGRRFTFYKFRSMVEDADRLKAALEHLNEREVVFKMANDPRVTPIGRLLRKFSIDEWPQFYNVLRGDMSIVGPRPPLPEEVERYQRWQRRRLRMRPGLTCLWAVMGRDMLDFNDWMRTDLSYIDNWSLQLDWSIMLKSIPYVIAGKGAH
jgi:exopolysaccharide biosynthesis polyprenyl glycosylphosphotransferase